MTTFGRGCRVVLVPAIAIAMTAIVSLAATGQDPKADQAAKTQTIDVKGLTVEVPEAWKQNRPTSSMRAAEIEVPAAEGEKPGELAVFVFPEGAGTVQANVQRWQQQFQGPGGKTPEVKSVRAKGKNVEVTRVEVGGTYVEPPFSGGGTFPNYRLLGAIVETPGAAYFFKLVGPEKTIQAAKDDFDAMISTMTAASK